MLIRFFYNLIFIPVFVIGTFFLSMVTLVAVFLKKPQVCAKIARFWGRMILSAGGVKVSVYGAENIDPAKAYIVTPNHESQFDIFAISGYLPFNIKWLAKKELFDIPVFGKAIEATGSIPIDRHEKRNVVKSIKGVLSALESGSSILIFPEGTRNVDGKLLPFKSGCALFALHSKKPILPVAIKGSRQVLPKNKFFITPGRIEIHIGEPISTESLTTNNRKEFIKNLRTIMEQMLA